MPFFICGTIYLVILEMCCNGGGRDTLTRGSHFIKVIQHHKEQQLSCNCDQNLYAEGAAGTKPSGECQQQLVRLLVSVFFESIIATSSESTLMILEVTNSFPSSCGEAMDYIQDALPKSGTYKAVSLSYTVFYSAEDQIVFHACWAIKVTSPALIFALGKQVFLQMHRFIWRGGASMVTVFFLERIHSFNSQDRSHLFEYFLYGELPA